jgi:hypothetical protein
MMKETLSIFGLINFSLNIKYPSKRQNRKIGDMIERQFLPTAVGEHELETNWHK